MYVLQELDQEPCDCMHKCIVYLTLSPILSWVYFCYIYLVESLLGLHILDCCLSNGLFPNEGNHVDNG